MPKRKKRENPQTNSPEVAEAEKVPADLSWVADAADEKQVEPTEIPTSDSVASEPVVASAEGQVLPWEETEPTVEPAPSEFAEAWVDAGVAQDPLPIVTEEVVPGEAAPEAAFGSGEDGALPTQEILSEGTLEAPLEGYMEGSRLESIIESLLFASDRALGVNDLKKLLGERDSKRIASALESLAAKRKDSGIEVTRLSSGWHLRTSAENAPWVSKLLQGKPLRLSRAMMETLAIVAYRQPVTRPEIDDIRGVDCGPVLKTLLERSLIRVIGKKEEVGRPMLYGTTPEFLRVFNLRELTELPTLREFYDLSAESQNQVEAEHGASPSATSPKPDVAMGFVGRGDLPPEPEENDPLLEELEEASLKAKQALGEAQEADAPPAENAEIEAPVEPSADPKQG